MSKKKTVNKSETVMNIITAVLIVLIIAAACVFVWDKLKDNKTTPDQDTDFTSETSSGGENTDADYC